MSDKNWNSQEQKNKERVPMPDGVFRVFGEGIKISMGGPGEPPFSKSQFRRALNEAIDYLVKGGQLGLAGTVYSIPRVSLEITAMIGAEAPASTWGILMARQQGVEKVAVVDVPKPDADSFYTGNQVGDVSRGTVREAWNKSAGSKGDTTTTGPDQEEANVPGVVEKQDPLARF